MFGEPVGSCAFGQLSVPQSVSCCIALRSSEIDIEILRLELRLLANRPQLTGVEQNGRYMVI